jgi:hypothetical protein
VTIEILYIDGCPNHRQTVERVRELLNQLHLAADVIEVLITYFASAPDVFHASGRRFRIDFVTPFLMSSA